MRDADDATAVVVGGGWAGLAAAVALTRRGVPVLLLEAARQLGGRARSLRIGDEVYDNGQHLMLGAYHAMLDLMQAVGVDPDEAFERLPLTMHLYKGRESSLKLRAPTLTAPLHLLVALVGVHGLSAAEKVRALRFSRQILQLQLNRRQDISVQALLHSMAQTPDLIGKLWAPLCVAMLNTAPELASAHLFVSVLRILFTGNRQHSDLLIARRELGALLPQPAGDFLETHGARVELGQRVTELELDDNSIQAVRVGSRRITCRQLILATPHVISRRLCSRHAVLQGLADRLARLGSEPVTTVYLHYPPGTRLPLPMVGFEKSLAQWVFDRRVCKQPGLMAVVISASGEHMQIAASELAARVAAELALAFPRWPAHRHSQVLREKRATFCARVGIDAERPGYRTRVAGLWLAGDYTATSLPATLEGAVRSGFGCADAVIEALNC